MTLGQGHDTPLGHGQLLCDIFSRSNLAVRSYGPDTHILLCVHCDLNLGGMTLSQGHDTPLGHGQQLCEILSRSNMAVRSYGPDTELGYVCTVALTLEVWPWVKVMTHPWVMDNNCVKYYPDPTWKWGVIIPNVFISIILPENLHIFQFTPQNMQKQCKFRIQKTRTPRIMVRFHGNEIK